MKAATASAVLIAAAAAAASFAANRPAGPPHETIKRITVYGKEACPKGEGSEIIICARRPGSDRYRVPEQFRNQPSASGSGASWASRSQSMEYVGRSGTESCSTVGPGGSTGCWNKLMRDARKEHPSH